MNKNLSLYKIMLKNDKIILKVFIIASVFLISFYLSCVAPKIFYFTTQTFSIVIAYCIVIIYLYFNKYYKNNFFTFLTIAYVFVGTINLMHIAMTKDTSVVVKYEYWLVYLAIIGRYIEIISFAYAFKFINKRINIRKIFRIYLIAVFGVVLIPIIFKWISIYKYMNVFNMIIRINPLILSILFLYLINILHKNKNNFKYSNYKMLMLFLILNIISEMCLIFYRKYFLFFKFATHFFRFITFCVLYAVIIKNNFKYPCECVSRELKSKEMELQKLKQILNIKNKQLEKNAIELGELKIKYKNFLDFLPDAILIHKSEKIVYVNKIFLNLFKFEHEKDILGKDIFTMVSDECKYLVRKRVNEEKQLKKIPFLEEKLLNKYGDIIELEVAVFPMKLENEMYSLVIMRKLQKRT